MKKLFPFLMLIIGIGCSTKNHEINIYPISPVEVRQVVLTDSFWLPKIQTIQKTTIPYAFNKCEKEGRMDNFLIAGGKMQGMTKGKMPFDDTDLYKIIEGASYSLISQPNPKLEAYIDSVIAIIKIGQEPDGYLTTWFTIDRMSPPAPWVTPSKQRWGGEISSHELYNSGHLFEAAAAHYLATGKRNFLNIALKNADLLVANFGPGKITYPPGHQIVETGLVKLYQITGKKEYLELAKFLLDERGNSKERRLYGAYSQDHLPVIKQKEAVGHAVRAVYMYAGMTDIAAAYHDSAYLVAVNAIWENMVTKKMYLTGGIGSRHDGEAFGNNYELPDLTAYNETCAAIGDVYWNHRLFLLTGDKKYYDIIERSLYNGLISGISIDGEKFFYPNPLECDAKFDFNKGSCERQGWFDCSCCPTNLIRFLPSVPGLIYALHADTLYVNLYASNNTSISINKTPVTIHQQTNYPLSGIVQMSVNTKLESDFTLKLRIPGWAMNQAIPGNLYKYIEPGNQSIGLKINNKEQAANIANGYIEISRKWKDGDQIELELPMELKKVTCDNKVAENQNKIAFEFGPLVYCAEQADNDTVTLATPLQNNLEIAEKKAYLLNNSLNEFVIKSKTKNSNDLTLIPYYLWDNRGVGKMKVWFKTINE